MQNATEALTQFQPTYFPIAPSSSSSQQPHADPEMHGWLPPENIFEYYWQLSHGAPEQNEGFLWSQWEKRVSSLSAESQAEALLEAGVQWIMSQVSSKEITAEYFVFWFNFYALVQRKFPQTTLMLPRLTAFPQGAPPFFAHLAALSEFLPFKTVVACLDLCLNLTQKTDASTSVLKIQNDLQLRWQGDVYGSINHLSNVNLTLFGGAIEWLVESLLEENIHGSKQADIGLCLFLCERPNSPFLTLFGILSIGEENAPLLRLQWLKHAPWIFSSLRTEKLLACLQKHCAHILQESLPPTTIDDSYNKCAAEWTRFLIQSSNKWPERQQALAYYLKEGAVVINLDTFFPQVTSDPIIAKQLLAIHENPLSTSLLVESILKLTDKTPLNPIEADLFLLLIGRLEISLEKQPLKQWEESERKRILNAVKPITLSLHSLGQRDKALKILESTALFLSFGIADLFLLLELPQNLSSDDVAIFQIGRFIQKILDNSDSPLLIRTHYAIEYLYLLLQSNAKSQKKLPGILEQSFRLLSENTKENIDSVRINLLSLILGLLGERNSLVKDLTQPSLLELDFLILRFFPRVTESIKALPFPFHAQIKPLSRDFFLEVVKVIPSVEDLPTRLFFIGLLEKGLEAFLPSTISSVEKEQLSKSLEIAIQTLAADGQNERALFLAQTVEKKGIQRPPLPSWHLILQGRISDLCSKEIPLTDEWIATMKQMWLIIKEEKDFPAADAADFLIHFLERVLLPKTSKQKCVFPFEELLFFMTTQSDLMKEKCNQVLALVLKINDKFHPVTKNFSQEALEAQEQLFLTVFDCKLEEELREPFLIEFHRQRYSLPSTESAATLWLDTLLSWKGNAKKAYELFLYGSKTCASFPAVHSKFVQCVLSLADKEGDVATKMLILEKTFQVKMGQEQKKELIDTYLTQLSKLPNASMLQMLGKLYEWDPSLAPLVCVFLIDQCQYRLDNENPLDAVALLVDPLLKKIENDSNLQEPLRLVVQETTRKLFLLTKNETQETNLLPVIETLFERHFSLFLLEAEDIWINYLYLHVVSKSKHIQKIWELTDKLQVFKDHPEKQRDAWFITASSLPYLDHGFFHQLLQNPEFANFIRYPEEALQFYSILAASEIQWNFSQGHIDTQIILLLSQQMERFITAYYKINSPYRFTLKSGESLQEVFDANLICCRGNAKMALDLVKITSEMEHKRMGIIAFEDPNALLEIDLIEIRFIQLLLESRQYAVAFQLFNGFLDRLHTIDGWEKAHVLVMALCASGSEVRTHFPQFHRELTGFIQRCFDEAILTLSGVDYFQLVPLLLAYTSMDEHGQITHPFIRSAARLLCAGCEQDAFQNMKNVWPLFNQVYAALFTLPFPQLYPAYNELCKHARGLKNLLEPTDRESAVENTLYALMLVVRNLHFYLGMKNQIDQKNTNEMIQNGLNSLELVLLSLKSYVHAKKTSELMDTLITCIISYAPYVSTQEQKKRLLATLEKFWNALGSQNGSVIQLLPKKPNGNHYFTPDEQYHWKVRLMEALIIDAETAQDIKQKNLFIAFVQQRHLGMLLEVKFNPGITKREEKVTEVEALVVRIKNISPQ